MPASRRVAVEPGVWTDGSLVDDMVSGSSSAGAWASARWVGKVWSWPHLQASHAFLFMFFKKLFQTLKRYQNFHALSTLEFLLLLMIEIKSKNKTLKNTQNHITKPFKKSKKIKKHNNNNVRETT